MAGKPVVASVRRIARVQTVVLVGRDDLQVREMMWPIYNQEHQGWTLLTNDGEFFSEKARELALQQFPRLANSPPGPLVFSSYENAMRIASLCYYPVGTPV